MEANEPEPERSRGQGGTPVDAAAEAFWDDRYRDRPMVWSGRVNPVLADEVADLAPGTALDLGCGEGGDAVWLAARGWRVTGVDISDVALDRAAARATEAGVAPLVTWQRHDLAQTFPDGTFDLVSAQFLQSPIELPRARVLRDAAAAVAPGGTLLVVGHAGAPPWARHHRADQAFPTPEQDLADLALARDRWDVVRCETAEREAEGPDGQHGTLVDGVLRVRRRSP